MTDVFEFRSGKFTPLSDDVLAKLTAEQLGTYTDLKSAVAQLDAANTEATRAIAVNRAALEVLRNAEAVEAKRPKYTFLDELRASQAQWRKDH